MCVSVFHSSLLPLLLMNVTRDVNMLHCSNSLIIVRTLTRSHFCKTNSISMTLIVNIFLENRTSQRSMCMLLRSIGYQLGPSMTLWDSCLNSIGSGRCCLVPEFICTAFPSDPRLVALVSGTSEDIFFDPYSLSLEMLLRRFCNNSLLT